MDALEQQIRRCLLAVEQSEFTKEQFYSVLREWSLGEGASLSTLLSNRLQLDQTTSPIPSSHSESADRFATFVVPAGSDTDPSIRSSNDTSPYPKLKESVPSKLESKTVGHNAVNTSGGRRFEILRPHARGGLGEVFIAKDVELQREVALKEIQLEHADDLECRNRFVLEAQVTGSLEHPGIVPVYAMGQHLDGRLYYAMRFVQGDSLKEAIDQSFEIETSENVSRIAGRPVVTFHKLLNRFMHVCHAVSYAHSRGVLHRDIKPANIMLGKFDETLLVDWGLAKIKGRDEQQKSISDSDEQTLRLGATNDSSRTQQGTLVGTPNFMSPEQAMGDTDAIGPHSDIYSLGATLFYLLTGQPPVRAANVADILRRVKRGEIDRPRQVLPSIPKSLEAICLKSLAFRPGDRYLNANELADDIERWLADEPVRADSESLKERFSRWLRRNRSAAATTVLGLALLCITSIGAFFFVNAARRTAVVKEREAIVARNESEQAKEDALKAQAVARAAEMNAVEAAADATHSRDEVKQALDLAEERLVQIEQLAKEKTMEAEKANQVSEFLMELFAASDPVRQGKGVFIGKPSSVTLSARDLLDRGASRLKDTSELADQPLTRASIAAIIGDVYRQLSYFDDAKPLLEEALQLRQQYLPPEHIDVAASLHELGQMYHEQGDYGKGVDYYTQALQIRRKVGGDEGDLLVANTLHHLAWIIANEGDAEQGEKLFLEAAQIRERLLGSDNRDAIFSYVGVAFCMIEQDRWVEAITKLLWAQRQLSNVDDNRNITEALTSFGQALSLRETLGSHVAQPYFETALRLTDLELGSDSIYNGLARYELAFNLVQLQRYDEALTHLEECFRISRESVQHRHPRVRALFKTLTQELARRKRTDEAIQLWEEFVSAQRSRFGDHHRFLYEAMISQTQFLKDVRKYDETITNFEKIIDGLERIEFKTRPWLLALCLSELCDTLCTKKPDFPKALEVGRKAERIFQEYPNLQTEHPIEWAYLQGDIAESMMLCKEPEVEAQLEKVIDCSKRIPASDRASAMNYALGLVSKWHVQNKSLIPAIETFKARLPFCKNDALDRVELAAQWAQCLDQAAASEAIAPEELDRLRIEGDAKILELLRRSLRVQPDLRNRIERDKRLQRIRELDGYPRDNQNTD